MRIGAGSPDGGKRRLEPRYTGAAHARAKTAEHNFWGRFRYPAAVTAYSALNAFAVDAERVRRAMAMRRIYATPRVYFDMMR